MFSSRCKGFTSLLQVNLIGCTDFGYFLTQLPNPFVDRLLHCKNIRLLCLALSNSEQFPKYGLGILNLLWHRR
jgi:hypothetical protein